MGFVLVLHRLTLFHLLTIALDRILRHLGTILAPLDDILLHLKSSRFEVGSIQIVIAEEHCHYLKVRVIRCSLELIQLDCAQADIVQLLHVFAIRLEASAVATSEHGIEFFPGCWRQEALEMERVLCGLFDCPFLRNFVSTFIHKRGLG